MRGFRPGETIRITTFNSETLGDTGPRPSGRFVARESRPVSSTCECDRASSRSRSFALLSTGGVSGISGDGSGLATVTDLSGSATNNMTADLIAYLVASVLVVVLIIIVVQVTALGEA